MNNDRSQSLTTNEVSSDDDEPLVNERGHQLYLWAVEQARRERRQARQGKATIVSRSTKTTKKPTLTIAQIDRVFEEKRQRPPMIRKDLMELYENCSDRIRPLLDRYQIDQFIEMIQQRT